MTCPFSDFSGWKTCRRRHRCRRGRNVHRACGRSGGAGPAFFRPWTSGAFASTETWRRRPAIVKRPSPGVAGFSWRNAARRRRARRRSEGRVRPSGPAPPGPNLPPAGRPDAPSRDGSRHGSVPGRKAASTRRTNSRLVVGRTGAGVAAPPPRETTMLEDHLVVALGDRPYRVERRWCKPTAEGAPRLRQRSRRRFRRIRPRRPPRHGLAGPRLRPRRRVRPVVGAGRDRRRSTTCRSTRTT